MAVDGQGMEGFPAISVYYQYIVAQNVRCPLQYPLQRISMQCQGLATLLPVPAAGLSRGFPTDESPMVSLGSLR
jgi:hypothetical protein